MPIKVANYYVSTLATYLFIATQCKINQNTGMNNALVQLSAKSLGILLIISPDFLFLTLRSEYI